MKHFFFSSRLFTLVAALLLLTSISVRAIDPELVVVTISEDGIAIGDREFILGPSVADLVELWGEPDRVENLVNDIRIWDDLGVRSYSEPGSRIIDSFSFTMGEPDLDLAAKSAFEGKIVTPTGTITKETSVADLKKMGLTPHEALPKLLELDTDVASFLVETDPDTGKVVTISIEFGL